MAKPAGYIEASDGGLIFTRSAARYVFIDARLSIQPPAWTPLANKPRFRIQMWRQITLGAGIISEEKWKGWDGTDGINSETGALNAEWKEYNDTPWNPARPTGEPLDLGSFTTITEEPRRASVPNHPVQPAHLKMLATTADNGEVVALHLAMENDEAFADSDPSSVRDYETIGRNPATWSPYNYNESFNAWLAQRLLVQNMNKVLYCTKQEWTVPL